MRNKISTLILFALMTGCNATIETSVSVTSEPTPTSTPKTTQPSVTYPSSSGDSSTSGGSSTTSSNSTSSSSSSSSSTQENTPVNFIYVTNETDNTISQFSVNPSNGSLTSLGSIATGVSPKDMVIDSAKKFVYVVNYGDLFISQYSIGSDGKLTALTATAGISANARYISFGSDGAVYAKLNNSNILKYTQNTTTGALTYVGSVSSGAASGVNATFLGHGSVSITGYAYSINSANARLEQVSTANYSAILNTFSTGIGPSSIAVK